MTEQYQNDPSPRARRTRRRTSSAHCIAPDRGWAKAQYVLAGIDHDIAQLDQSILAEETATRLSDHTDFKYSLAARHMRARRDNLVSTKAVLLTRLAPHSLDKVAGQS